MNLIGFKSTCPDDPQQIPCYFPGLIGLKQDLSYFAYPLVSLNILIGLVVSYPLM
jgi:hypothetical protein